MCLFPKGSVSLMNPHTPTMVPKRMLPSFPLASLAPGSAFNPRRLNYMPSKQGSLKKKMSDLFSTKVENNIPR